VGRFDLLNAGQQSGAVCQRPPIVLRVSHLDAAGTCAMSRNDHVADARNVPPVHDDVDCQRKSEGNDGADRPLFPRVSAGETGDVIGVGRVRVLPGELDVIEPGCGQLLESRFAQTDTGRNQISIETCP
jgi:hypothetical protein